MFSNVQFNCDFLLQMSHYQFDVCDYPLSNVREIFQEKLRISEFLTTKCVALILLKQVNLYRYVFYSQSLQA